MKKYAFRYGDGGDCMEGPDGTSLPYDVNFYLASEVDARIEQWERELVKLIHSGAVSIGYVVERFGISIDRLYEVNRSLLSN